MNAKLIVTSLSLALLSIGCASTSNRPVQELATARASITLAEQNGAQQHSTAALTKARQKLTRAGTLADNGDSESATRFANEAEVDARVAAAESTLRKSKQAAADLDQSLDTLESELQRAQ